MEEASTFKNTSLPAPMAFPEEKAAPVASPKQNHMKNLKPFWRMSPRQHGSSLYDSYELKAMANQINKVMEQGSNNSTPPLVTYLESPFYRQHLSKIYKENARTPRQITCLGLSRRLVEKRLNRSVGGVAGEGFFGRLWKKVKRGVLRNNHKDDDDEPPEQVQM